MLGWIGCLFSGNFLLFLVFLVILVVFGHVWLFLVVSVVFFRFCRFVLFGNYFWLVIFSNFFCFVFVFVVFLSFLFSLPLYIYFFFNCFWWISVVFRQLVDFGRSLLFWLFYLLCFVPLFYLLFSKLFCHFLSFSVVFGCFQWF